MKYVALLRGVNIGGVNRVVMSELKNHLVKHGLTDVLTYINSGNVLFESPEHNTQKLAANIKTEVKKLSSVECDVVVVSKDQFIALASQSPKWWGKDPDWKHNALFLIEPTKPRDVVQAIGTLKPGIEAVEAANSVVYQSLLFSQFGKTTTGKLASNPVYKRVTIRNYNTVQKIAQLLQA